MYMTAKSWWGRGLRLSSEDDPKERGGEVCLLTVAEQGTRTWRKHPVSSRVFHVALTH
jgi:hypothetical protein